MKKEILTDLQDALLIQSLHICLPIRYFRPPFSVTEHLPDVNILEMVYGELPGKCRCIFPELSNICIDMKKAGAWTPQGMTTALYQPPDLLHNPAFADGSLRPPKGALSDLFSEKGGDTNS